MKETLPHFSRQLLIKKKKSWNLKSATLIRWNQKNKLISRYRPLKKHFFLIICTYTTAVAAPCVTRTLFAAYLIKKYAYFELYFCYPRNLYDI